MAFGSSILATLGLDTRGFNQKSQSVQQQSNKLKSELGKIGVAFGAGLAVAGFKRLTEEMDNLGKTASKLGVGTDFLQEMRFAGEQTGVAVNTTDMAMQRFTRRLGEAKNGAGELLPTLEKYGIALENLDGTTRTNEEVLKDLADVIQNTNDPTERLAIAFKAFDSEGAALVNTLKDGSKGLDDYASRAHSLGQVVNKENIEKFEKLNDRLSIVKGALTSAAATAGGAFLSLGEKAGEFAGGIAFGFDAMKESMEEAEGGAKKVADEMDAAVTQLEKISIIQSTILENQLAENDAKQAAVNRLEELNVLEKENLALLEEAKAIGIETEEGLRLQQVAQTFLKGIEQERLRIKKEGIIDETELGELAQKAIAEAEKKESIEDKIKKLESERLELIKESFTVGLATNDVLALREAVREREIELTNLRNDAAQEGLEIERMRTEEAEKQVDAAAAQLEIRRQELGIIRGKSNQELTSEQLNEKLGNLERELRDSQIATQQSGFFGKGFNPLEFFLKNQIGEIKEELLTRFQVGSIVGGIGPDAASDFFSAFDFESLQKRAEEESQMMKTTNELLEEIKLELRGKFRNQ